VLSLGGDGTHNEVVNGIMSANPAPGAVTLGLLPAGTGGDFRRGVRDNADVETAARAVGTANRVPIDVGHVTYRADSGADESRWFVNISSFGIGGLVDRIVNDGSKRLGGKASFFLATFKALRRYRPARVRLVVDGAEQGVFDITNIFVCNGRYAGGGMLFAPDARLGDGLFDVVITREMGFLRSLTTAGKFYDGSHVRLPETTTLRGKHIVATTLSDDPAYIDIDGEAPGGLPAEYTMHPGAIQLLNPLDGVV
jgi:diacylglycerol kinase (ATP)